MKFLKTTEREGHPFTLDDAGFIQDAFKDAFSGLLKGFNGANNSFIITGCELGIVSGNLILSAGWVCLNGEIHQVDTANFGGVAFSPPAPYWVLTESALPPSPVYYQDSSLKNVHLNRKATLSGTNPGGAILYSATKRLHELVSLMGDKMGSLFTLTNSWVAGAMPVSDPGYEVEGKRCFLYGDIRFSGAVPLTNAPFATLPVGARPARATTYPATIGTGFANNYVQNTGASWVFINTAGECYADCTLTESIQLGSINFRVA